jgi:tetratricopeptide (TPR) repeat protein
MVNYDAIAKFCKGSGGEPFLPCVRPQAIAVGAFAWKHSDLQRNENRGQGAFPRLGSAFRTSVGTFGPDELYIALEAVGRPERLTLAQIVAVIRLSRYCASVLLRLADALLPFLNGISGVARDELRLVILETWNRALPLGPPEEDLAFRCGALLLHLRFYADAVVLLEASVSQYGPAPATAYNLGLCYLAMDRDDLALASLREASELDPAFEEPRSQIVALTARKQLFDQASL